MSAVIVCISSFIPLAQRVLKTQSCEVEVFSSSTRDSSNEAGRQLRWPQVACVHWPEEELGVSTEWWPSASPAWPAWHSHVNYLETFFLINSRYATCNIWDACGTHGRDVPGPEAWDVHVNHVPSSPASDYTSCGMAWWEWHVLLSSFCYLQAFFDPLPAPYWRQLV